MSASHNPSPVRCARMAAGLHPFTCSLFREVPALIPTGWYSTPSGAAAEGLGQRGVKQELPTPRKGRRPRGLRRRSVVLKVAATLFAGHGFDSVSMNQIGGGGRDHRVGYLPVLPQQGVAGSG
jgi:hypothetical protein